MEKGRSTETLVIVVAVITASLGFLIAILFSRYLMRKLGGEPQDAVAAVQALANGDLTSVMDAVANMHERLRQLVSSALIR